MKDCKDCKFSKKSWFVRKCYNPNVMVVDIVKALGLLEFKQFPVYCSIARKKEYLCGEKGSYFIEKDGPQDENERRI